MKVSLPAFYGEPELFMGGTLEPLVIQEINDEWYVFPAHKLDEETGHYYGAIVAGAQSREEALVRAGITKSRAVRS